jgi:ankyrin repeat protein
MNIIRSIYRESKDKDGRTPLHEAASIGATKAALKLIAAGADVNIKSSNGLGPLHLAIEKNCTDIALALLAEKERINPNLQDSAGLTPLHYAIAWKRKEVLSSLLPLLKKDDLNIESSNGTTPLLSAISLEDPETASKLIAEGADVNIESSNGMTPLRQAIIMDDPETASKLIAEGADVNAKYQNGLCPIQYAIGRSRAASLVPSNETEEERRARMGRLKDTEAIITSLLQAKAEVTTEILKFAERSQLPKHLIEKLTTAQAAVPSKSASTAVGRLENARKTTSARPTLS